MLVSALLFMIASNVTPSAAVAECADHVILYIDITVGDRALSFPRGPKGAALDESQIQHAIEQENLDRRIVTLALNDAVQHFGLRITAAELERALPEDVRDENAFRSGFASVLAVPRAARRVLHGEEKAKVFDELHRDFPTITTQFFEESLTIFNSDEAIDRFLAVDQAAKTRQRVIEQTRLGLIKQKLVRIAEERAKDQNESVESAKTKLWREVLTAARARIFDDEFQLPSSKGIL